MVRQVYRLDKGCSIIYVGKNKDGVSKHILNVPRQMMESLNLQKGDVVGGTLYKIGERKNIKMKRKKEEEVLIATELPKIAEIGLTEKETAFIDQFMKLWESDSRATAGYLLRQSLREFGVVRVKAIMQSRGIDWEQFAVEGPKTEELEQEPALPPTDDDTMLEEGYDLGEIQTESLPEVQNEPNKVERDIAKEGAQSHKLSAQVSAMPGDLIKPVSEEVLSATNVETGIIKDVIATEPPEPKAELENFIAPIDKSPDLAGKQVNEGERSEKDGAAENKEILPGL